MTRGPQPPVVFDPEHFDVGDRVVFGWDNYDGGYAGGGYAGVLASSALDHEGCVTVGSLPPVRAGDTFRTRPANLVHQGGCDACDGYRRAWTDDQARLREATRGRLWPFGRLLRARH